MRNITRGMLVAGMCVMVAGGVLAQQVGQDRNNTDRTGRNQTQQTGSQDKQACMASKMMDMTVKAQNEECGKLTDLIIGSDGSVKYLVIAPRSTSHDADRTTATNPETRGNLDDQDRQSTDRDTTDRSTAGFGGQGDLVVVPWELAKFEEGSSSRTAGTITDRTSGSQSGTIVLNIEKSRLEQAPKFSKSDLEQQLQQNSEIAKVEQFFGSRQQRGAARPPLNQNQRDRETDTDRSPNRQEDNNDN